MQVSGEMPCLGDRDDHCCYVNGVACQYLEENTVPGRRWACRLRRELGSWEAVHADMGYQVNVQSVWDSLGTREDGTPVIISCGDWPTEQGACGTCGARTP